MANAKTVSELDWKQVAHTLQENQNIIAAWVFGSAKDGHVRRGSDIDIAILFNARPNLDELVTLRMALQDALRFDAIDIVVLNGASAITRLLRFLSRRHDG